MIKLFGNARFANVTSILALVIALSGTSYAAVAIPRNSVGTPQLKNSAVTSAKVKDGALKAKDLAAGVLLSKSKVYVAGDPNLSTATMPLSVSVPAGTYLVHLQTTAYNGPATPTNTLCQITGESRIYGNINSSGNAQQALAGFAVVTLGSAGTIGTSCSPGTVTFGYSTLIALRVGATVTSP